MIVGQVVDQLGTGVSGLGTGVSSLGSTVNSLPVLGATNAGGLVNSAGQAVTSIGTGLSDGLGQLGTGGNAVGTTVAGVGTAVSNLGGGLGAVADSQAIQQLPVVGGVVGQVAETVTMLGNTLSTQSTTGPLGGVTQGLSDTAVQVVSLVENTTGNLGTATGLGAPLDSALQQVGNVLTLSLIHI